VKLTDGKTSRTHIRALSPDERVEELARMLGGIEITERTRAHAEEMIRVSGRGDSTAVSGKSRKKRG
jgi:DNA repair protein RecN (Recombination protein N)